MNLNGGYAMIAYDATQKELEVAYKTKRPVLLYDANHRAHWAQINEKEVETVDEETQETIITYEYSYQLLNAIEALVDDNGNSRFIEGDLETEEITGVTFTYAKWSLSGTHLMIVCAGSVENGTAIASQTYYASVTLPLFIFNKIYPVTGNLVDFKSVTYYSENPVTTQNANCDFIKDSENGKMRLRTNSITLTAKRNFRIQFDLLIDTE